MSMKLIYGKAGTGKSSFIFKEIKKQLKENLTQKIYIIVPEQFSYATEKRLLETLEENASINAEVISFKRLAHRIALEVGGNNETILSKTGRTMLMEYILEQNKKKLNFLGKSSDVDLALRTITELKKHNVNESMLQEQINNIDNEYLKLKLKDINEIYSEYQKTILNNYIDEDDILTILGKNIKHSKMFDNSIVYIDEFSGFTEQEYVIIEEILKKAKTVNITICTDELEANKNPENDIFYSNKQSAQKLIKCANNCRDEQCSSMLETPIQLKECFRFKNDELKFLEKSIDFDFQ